MTRYTYTHLAEFFTLSTWREDINGSFGLRPPPGDWEGFKARIAELNASCLPGESVKVIYAARHGQAEHNVLSERYGLRLVAALKGRSVHHEHPILDPLLTPLGRQQAAALGAAFKRESERGMPLPEVWFVSPLRRTSETCGIEWGWYFRDARQVRAEKVAGDDSQCVPAVVVENLREHLHVHQCDARLPISVIRADFPTYTYPADISDQDTMWQPIEVRGRETEDELVLRAGRAIGEVFQKSGSATYISVTSHSGALRGVFKSLGVPTRKLETSEMNVLVIRVKEVDVDAAAEDE